MQNRYLCRLINTDTELNCKLVILDFDGTVGDTNELIIKTMLDTMADLGLETCTRNACNATIGLPLANSFRTLYPDLSDEQVTQCTEVYRAHFKQNQLRIPTPLFPHVRETLSALQERSILVSLASSRQHASLVRMVEVVEIQKYISFLIATDDVRNPKPEPDLVLKTLEHFGLQPEQALVVGDAPYDIRMGKSAGCRTIGVTYGNGTPEALISAGADRITDDFADILEYI